jgi:hypothetical protein
MICKRSCTHLREIRTDVMLTSMEVDYLRAIALVTVSDDESTVRRALDAMISRVQREMQNH